MARGRAERAIVLSAVLVAVGFGGLAFARTALPVVATVVVWTFGEMIFFPTGTAYVAEIAPAGRTGEYMGALSSTFALAMVVGPWAGAALLDRFGGVVTWTVMLGCGLAAAALFGLSTPSATPSAAIPVRSSSSDAAPGSPPSLSRSAG